MLTRPPTFFEDMGRHGLGVAWDKRFGSYSCAGQSFKYGDLRGWNWQQLEWLLGAAAAEGNLPCVSHAFEWMLIQASGDIAQPWRAAMAVLGHHTEDKALPVVEVLLKYVPNLEVLKSIEHGSWASYLVGKTFADQAAKKSSKSDLQEKKKLALHFLGNSRTRLEWEKAQPSADPYRTAAIAAALGAAVAAAYEGAAYLQWKGTRTTALAE
jgi:hypothetical protein